MDLQNMSQTETEEPSKSIFDNADFIAIIGQQTLIHYQFVITFIFLGGVVCFWGGIVLLGLLFMLALMVKNYLVNNIYNKKFDE